MKNFNKTILLVDNIGASRVAAKWFFNCFDYVVELAGDADEALALFNSEVHDVVLTDNFMVDMRGDEMVRSIKAKSPKTPIVRFTCCVPEDQTGIDVLIVRPRHLLYVKEAFDRLLNVQNGIKLTVETANKRTA